MSLIDNASRIPALSWEGSMDCDGGGVEDFGMGLRLGQWLIEPS